MFDENDELYLEEDSNAETSDTKAGWDARPNTYIKVNGSFIGVHPGSVFIDTVKSEAKNASLGKFRVFVDDVEVDPTEAPEAFGEGMKVELRPYDDPGYAG